VASATGTGANSAIILAGGRSSRIGRPKALLTLAGEPLLIHVAHRLLAACDDLIVVAAPPGIRDPHEDAALGEALSRLAASRGLALDRGAPSSRSARRDRVPPSIRLVYDPVADRGPVAGLAVGLGAAAGPLAFVSACDMPFLTESLVRGLLALAAARREVDLVIPRTAGGLEPLVAVYRASTMAAHYAQQLADGELRPTARLAERVVREVSGPELERLDPGLESFLGVNDATDYEAARGRAAGFSARPRRRAR
jgi:molybdenum cofactor guanylyltransferase